MTGRRLYDAVCDGWSKQWQGYRKHSAVLRFIPQEPVHWSFLGDSERRAFNDAARRLTPKPKPKEVN